MRFNPFLIKSEGWRRFSIAAGFAALVAWIIFIPVTVYDTYTAPRSGFTPIGATPAHLDKALGIILVGLAFIILAYIAIMIVLHTALWVARGFKAQRAGRDAVRRGFARAGRDDLLDALEGAEEKRRLPPPSRYFYIHKGDFYIIAAVLILAYLWHLIF